MTQTVKNIIRKRLRHSDKLTCKGCEKLISIGKEFVRLHDGPYHLFCAADDQKLDQCMECFTVGGQCMCKEF